MWGVPSPPWWHARESKRERQRDRERARERERESETETERKRESEREGGGGVPPHGGPAAFLPVVSANPTRTPKIARNPNNPTETRQDPARNPGDSGFGIRDPGPEGLGGYPGPRVGRPLPYTLNPQPHPLNLGGILCVRGAGPAPGELLLS